MMRWLLLVVTLLLGTATGVGEVRAADGAEESYQLAYSRFKNLLYEDAAEILRKLLAVKIEPEKELERAKVYKKARPIFVACLFGIAAVVDDGQAANLLKEADEAILAQYRQDPFFKLPSGFSQQVSDRWTRVYFENRDELEGLKEQRIADQQRVADRAAKRAKLEADRLRQLEELAAEQSFVETRSRVVAAIPFGVGQFQNDNVGLGVFFAAFETATVVGSIVSWGIAEDIKNTKCPDTQVDAETGELRTVECGPLMTNFEIARAFNYTLLSLTAAVAITGIIQAQIAFEPERTRTRRRPIPPPITMAPTAVVTPEGAYAGVLGAF